MEIFDITVPIRSGMAVWPGDESVTVKRVSKIEEDEVVNISNMSMCVHTGTHIDAPFHFFADGETVDQIPLENLIGKVQVIDVSENAEIITVKELSKIDFLPGIERVLLKTSNSKKIDYEDNQFHQDFVALSEDGARFLVEKGIRLIGVDYLSIAPFNDTIPTHVQLLKSKVVILEGLNLRSILPGIYTLYCLPMKLVGTDGAPVRAILIRD